jgi:hypothetical protein
LLPLYQKDITLSQYVNVVQPQLEKYYEPKGFVVEKKSWVSSSKGVSSSKLAKDIRPTSTIQSTGKINSDFSIITDPSILKKQVAVIDGSPQYEYTFVEPKPAGEVYSYTPATKEQIDLFESQQRVLTGNEKQLPHVRSLNSEMVYLYKDVNDSLKKALSIVPAEKVGESVAQAIKFPTFLFSGKNEEILNVKDPISESVKGFSVAIIKDIQENPV